MPRAPARRPDNRKAVPILSPRVPRDPRKVAILGSQPPGVPWHAHKRLPEDHAGGVGTPAGKPVVADALASWPTRISRLERGLVYDGDLAKRYRQWLAQCAWTGTNPACRKHLTTIGASQRAAIEFPQEPRMQLSHDSNDHEKVLLAAIVTSASSRFASTIAVLLHSRHLCN